MCFAKVMFTCKKEKHEKKFIVKTEKIVSTLEDTGATRVVNSSSIEENVF